MPPFASLVFSCLCAMKAFVSWDKVYAMFALVWQLWQNFDYGQWVIECLSDKARQISDLGRIIWKSPKWLLNHFKTKLLWFMNCERKIKRKRRKLMSVACTDVSSHVQCLVGQSKQRQNVKISMCFNTKEIMPLYLLKSHRVEMRELEKNIKIYHS